MSLPRTPLWILATSKSSTDVREATAGIETTEEKEAMEAVFVGFEKSFEIDAVIDIDAVIASGTTS